MRSTKTTRDSTAPGGEAMPLGPDSLTWKYISAICAPGCSVYWIGSLQNMYPQLGAGVEDHSILASRAATAGRPLSLSDRWVSFTTANARQTGEQIKGFSTPSKVSIPQAAAITHWTRNVLLGRTPHSSC